MISMHCTVGMHIAFSLSLSYAEEDMHTGMATVEVVHNNGTITTTHFI